MTNFFIQLYDCLLKIRKSVLFLSFLLILLMGWLVAGLNFEEDISGFLPQSEENKRINTLYNNTSSSDKIIIRLRSSDSLAHHNRTSQLIESAEALAVALEKLDTDSLIGKIHLSASDASVSEMISFVYTHIPYFLSDDDFRKMDSIVTKIDYAQTIRSNKETLLSPIGQSLASFIQADPLHIAHPILEKLKNLNSFGEYILLDDYLFSKDSSSLYLFIESNYPASDTKHNAQLAQILDCAASQSSKDISIDYFGACLVGVANAERIKNDSFWAVCISLLLIIALLLFFFRSLPHLLSLFIPVLFGALFALSVIFLLKGSISLIALGAGSVIVGIAVNYSLHFLSHLKQVGEPRLVLKEISHPMLIGNITTVGAFLSLLFVSSPAMHDFGLFAALALIGSIGCVLVLYPLLFQEKGNRIWSPSINRHLSLGGHKSLAKIKPIKGWVFILMTLLFAYWAAEVDFDSDLHKINYMTADQRSVFDEFKTDGTLGQQTLFVIAEGRSLEQALNTHEAQKRILAAYADSCTITGIGDFLPSDSIQRVRLSRWNNYWRDKSDSVIHLIHQSATKEGFTADAFDGFTALLKYPLQPAPLSYFSPIKDNVLSNFIIEQDSLAMILSIVKTPTLPTGLLTDLQQISNSYLINNSSMAAKLVADLSHDFNYVLFICGMLVFVFLWIAFRRIELTILAFIPMLLSWIWILGIMHLLDIRFNIVNIILATFIFGMGDDYVIFMVDGLTTKYRMGKRSFGNYNTSIILSALTMFIGIGILSFAQHPAMRSLGLVAAIGMLVVTFCTFFVTPSLFSYLTQKRGQKRLMPITLLNGLITFYAFLVFLAGSLFLTAAGFVRITLLGASRQNKERYHILLHRLSCWVVRNMIQVEHSYQGSAENFGTPGIIICNHQSHLDLMYLLSLTPKLIVLTNKWVWRFPIYGQIIRYADFYPLHDKGIEESLTYLRPLINQGYSIAIFPEGTRSPDCTIQRFHRGAFFLAEQLQLDIIPVLFHGIGHIFPKQEFLLRKGKVNTWVLPRIAYNDPTYGADYKERTKHIRRYLVSQYNEMATELETPAYFTDLVIKNYIYKGKSIQKKAHTDMAQIHLVDQLAHQIPPNTKVLLYHCSIGVHSLLLALSRKDIEIVATDPCPENIQIASCCSSVPQNLRYDLPTAISEKEFKYTIDLHTLTLHDNEI